MVAVSTSLKFDGVQDFSETVGSTHHEATTSEPNAVAIADVRLADDEEDDKFVVDDDDDDDDDDFDDEELDDDDDDDDDEF